MTTYRKVRDFWTETKRVINGEVKQVTCACAAPASWPKACALAGGSKAKRPRCACFCHTDKLPAHKEQA